VPRKINLVGIYVTDKPLQHFAEAMEGKSICRACSAVQRLT
jgi:hypothetical protein